MEKNDLEVLKNDLEALKMLADWSKWLVLVQTGAITVIGAFWKPEVIARAGFLSKILMSLTILCFAVSIVAAANLLKSLPATAQRLPPPPGKDIFHMGTYEGTQGVKVYTVAKVETYSFILGFFCFVLAVMASMWCLP
jgi:hypothetical protein